MKRWIRLVDLVVILVVVTLTAYKILWHGLGDYIPVLEGMAVHHIEEQKKIAKQIGEMLGLLFEQNPEAALLFGRWRERMAGIRSPAPAVPVVYQQVGSPEDVWSRFVGVMGQLSVWEQDLVKARAIRNEVWEVFRERFKGPVVMRISEDVLRFPPGQDMPVDLSPLATIFSQALRRAREGYRFISVEAHCDNQPIHTAGFPSNWELSHARALFLARRLQAYLGRQGLRPGVDFVISAAGFGEWLPIASNGTPKGRSRNRRLEIVFLKRPLLGGAGQ